MRKKVMSMCVSSDYCYGYNDAVDAINKGEPVKKYKSPCCGYYMGWNDAIREFEKED